MTYSMTEEEARTLARDIHEQYGWLVEVDHLKGQPANNRPTPFFVRVHAPATVPAMEDWTAHGRCIYSLDEHIRRFCPSAPDYGANVAMEALAALPQTSRMEWLTLADNSTLYFWRSYRGHHYSVETLTGAATISLHTKGAERKNIHLRPGWTDEQFLKAVQRLLSQHMVRPEWREVTYILYGEALKIRQARQTRQVPQAQSTLR